MSVVESKRAISPVAATSQKKRTAKRSPARVALNMRIRPEVRSLIDRAAELTGKNRTDFVLDAAHLAAQNALLDRTLIPLGTKSYAAFMALLDAPAKPNKGLLKSLRTRPEWE